MRARVDEARAAGMSAVTREACAALARWLASRDRDLDEAVDLALEALRGGDDVELRREVAAWLESLGEAGARGGRPPANRVDAGRRVGGGVVRPRADGRAQGARRSRRPARRRVRRRAVHRRPSDPLPAELLGALAEWEPDAVPDEAAAEAYVEAARRRASQGSDEAELEDLWRAFAVDATSGRAVQALVDALERRGEQDAADEVWREHARRVGGRDAERAAVVHARRRDGAAATHAGSRALAAALDEGLDTSFDGDGAAVLDGILLGLGMHEAVAARLVVRGSRGAPADRAAHLVELARLCAGPLADQTRATAAYVAALAADPRATRPPRRCATGTADASVAYAHEDDQTDSRASTATAWVRAAVSGDVTAQVHALERVASTTTGSVRAVLLSTAAERARASGDTRAARRLAELAVHAELDEPAGHRDPRGRDARGDARPLGGGGARARDRRRGPARGWCASLADALDALGETALAVGWSQRCVALRPGDREAIEKLLDRLVRSGDGGRLGDALAWLLSQPQAASWLGAPFARALRDLATLDVDRGAVVARRALDVFGPKLEPLRDAMLEVAERASDHGFAAAVFERWPACSAEGTERSPLLVRLADLRERLGDDEGEARVVARAAQEGVASPEIDRHLERLDERPLGPDGQLWRLRARAERLGLSGDAEAASLGWRDLGAALWDLADDRVGAISAWQRAARLSKSRGHATLALDLVAFAGSSFAFEYLARLIETEPDAATAAVVAADVARAALSSRRATPRVRPRGAGPGAHARRAPTPSRSPSARPTSRASTPRLSALYELVASRALGRFGRRAAHYRGARFFERHGERGARPQARGAGLLRRALGGLVLPAPGARGGARGDRAQAVRTIELVAEASERSAARAGWLLRAASIAGDGEEGVRRKVDVLLRASVASPNVATIGLLRDAGRDLLRLGPEERDALELRLARAARTITDRLDGPEGARVAIAFAGASLELFADAEGAFASIERAFGCDADVDEYAELVGWASTLAVAADARERTAKLLDAAEGPHANVGVAVLRLLAAVAAAVGDDGLRARASVAAALREPEDDSLVIDADAAVRARTGARRAARLQRVPHRRRADALLAAARSADERGSPRATRPRSSSAPSTSWTARSGPRWSASFARPGTRRGGGARSMPASSARRPAGARRPRCGRTAGWRSPSGARRAGTARAPCARSSRRASSTRAPGSMERPRAGGRGRGRRRGPRDRARRRSRRASATTGVGAVFKRLARAHERRGDLDAAIDAWARVLALDPEDEEADHSVESLIVARGRYDELADHLARRADRLSLHSGTREVLRAVRLRRAAILEQTPRSYPRGVRRARAAPRGVARQHGRAPLPGRSPRPSGELSAESAPLWRRAAALETDPTERDQLELRAGRASMTAGDLEAAMDHATRVLQHNPGDPGRPRAAGRGRARSRGGRRAGRRARRHRVRARRGRARAERSPARGGASRSARRRSGGRARARAFAPPPRPRSARRRSSSRAGSSTGCAARARRTRRATPSRSSTRIREPLGPDDDALRAFLLAEALDVVQGGGAGLHELEATRAVVGDHPLVALGLAERFVVDGAAHGGRRRVSRRARRLAPRPPAGRGSWPSSPRTRRCDAIASRTRRGSSMSRHVTRSARGGRGAEGALVDLHRVARRSTLAPDDPSPPVGRSAPRRAQAGADARLDELEAAVRFATSPGERARARLALGRARLAHGDARGAEPLLWEALADGLSEAGDVLCAPAGAVARARARPRARPAPAGRARARRHRAPRVAPRRRPGRRRPRLRARGRARASRLRRRGRAAPAPAARGPAGAAGDVPAAGPAVDGRRRARRSRSSGRARCSSSSATRRATASPASSASFRGPRRPSRASTRRPCAPSTCRASRSSCLGPRQARPWRTWRSSTPPSVILAGDVREDIAGASLRARSRDGAALPHNVLRLGLPPTEGRALVEAMRAAFGPPEIGRHVDAPAARLAESFWQIIPARTQRRLQELLGAADGGRVRGPGRPRPAERAACRPLPRGRLRVARRAHSWPSSGSSSRRRSARSAACARRCRRSRICCAWR